jgi:ATP-dependent RNA helicase RhlE
MTTIATGAFLSEETKRTTESFDNLSLSQDLLRAVRAEGYSTPTPIQLQAIPHVLQGRDLLGCAQTGTGKTAAFALPILHRLSAAPRNRRAGTRVLVLAPTRELALQIEESFRTYGRHAGLTTVSIYGGVNQNPQTRALRSGVDILVATPGRLLDLMAQGYVDLRSVETLVLDEADRMLDMGFIHDVRRIVGSLPKERQTLLFSATMPEQIRSLAQSVLKDPVTVQVAAESARADHIEQTVYFVEKTEKAELLRQILAEQKVTRALVFTRTKHGADRLAKVLQRSGIRVGAIHGDKAQGARIRAMEDFRSLATPVLIATDLAARGIDIDEISHVVNYDLPHEPETYVHRIGRTARAGATGVALSFCDFEERPRLFAIERLIREPIPVMRDGVRDDSVKVLPEPPRNSRVVYRTPRRRR